MTDDRRESVQEREDRVQKAREDRDRRHEKAPLTGVTSQDEVLRHLVTHGPARNEAERDELFAALEGRSVTDDQNDTRSYEEREDEAVQARRNQTSQTTRQQGKENSK